MHSLKKNRLLGFYGKGDEMFKKILIANRGEIARRIIRTARSMGIETVAVYAPDESHALFIKDADQAVCLHGTTLAETYLNSEKIVHVAVETGAEAIHPGYGFLSENKQFAELCAVNGIVFVGPRPDAMALMSSKSDAKGVAVEAGIPVIPGYEGDNQSLEVLAREAQRIGFPLMIKAVMGGGGKGMRQVVSPHDFEGALASCQREALNAFADSRVLLERYIPFPRHIEVQVFGDHHGHVVHMFERDCSLQRRHQKIIEEAPAYGLSDEVRQSLCDAAVKLARHVNYTGAGTVEFLVDRSQNFYFMEMNTRLQVEHPVTEMITGLDLVEWQLRVASGESLPCTQDHITMTGTAIECRVYAEDPEQNFLPSTGTIDHIRWDERLRIDSGIQSGDRVTPTYDPMIAKLITHGGDRQEALQKMRSGLTCSAVLGSITTNQRFLMALLDNPVVVSAETDVGWLDRGVDLAYAPVDETTVLAVAACAFLACEPSSSPWGQHDGWTVGGNLPISLTLLWNDGEHYVECVASSSGWNIQIEEKKLSIAGVLQDHMFQGFVNDQRISCPLYRSDNTVRLSWNGSAVTLVKKDRLETSVSTATHDNHLCAPMTGKIIHMAVAMGDHVEAGDVLVILEAMKMEHAIKAPHKGIITKSPFGEGDVVDQGVELVELAVNG